jgi:peptidoglycan/LPS O-acetylase OafA/YrhL
LSVEAQFYLVFPVFLLLIHRLGDKVFWLAIAAALVASFSLNAIFVVSKPEATFYLLPTRAWELLAGGMVPFIATLLPTRQRFDEMLGLVGVGLIFAAVLLYNPALPFPGTFALIPVLGATCLLLSGRQHTTLVARILAWAPLAYIGRISYSLYLVHWPVTYSRSNYRAITTY